MRRLVQILVAVLVVLALLTAWVLVAAPRTGWPDLATLPAPEPGDDLDAWLDARESVFGDIVPGTEKAINWAGAPGERTALAVVYIHGFSASRREISPVPETIAANLGANYFGTRLAGHGRADGSEVPGEALGAASVEDWALDLAEAMAIGRRLGERVVLIGTSTGGSLVTLAALEPGWQGDIAALITVSPNFALNNNQAWMLDLPYAPRWLHHIGGTERSFTPYSDDHALYWTERYPSRALFPLRTIQRAAAAADHAAAQVPMLVFYAAGDRVVVPAATARVIERWGARADAHVLDNAEDPGQHVITGDIRSPATNAFVIQTALDWLADL
ncbi:MAG: alpha/beta hydrolase [Pararhodobacter sp.]|nr:alpha/beta hydrolase [Pararhodobacter sp.]